MKIKKLEIRGACGLEPNVPLFTLNLNEEIPKRWYYLQRYYVDANTHFISAPSDKDYVNKIPLFMNVDVEETGMFYIGHN